VSSDRSRLQYGVSVTDGCIGWEETEELLLEAHARLA
jgi:3-deoxy-7-phosphoheptulonate synthase